MRHQPSSDLTGVVPALPACSPDIASVSCLAARSMSWGRAWVYRARVIVAAPVCLSGVACPISTEATFGLTPAASSQVQALWRAFLKSDAS
jgi:hypothetical protein